MYLNPNHARWYCTRIRVQHITHACTSPHHTPTCLHTFMPNAYNWITKVQRALRHTPNNIHWHTITHAHTTIYTTNTYVHTYAHTYVPLKYLYTHIIYTHTHAYLHTYKSTYCTNMHASMLRCLHATRILACSLLQSYLHTCMREGEGERETGGAIYIYIYTYVCIYRYIDIYIYIHISRSRNESVGTWPGLARTCCSWVSGHLARLSTYLLFLSQWALGQA